MDNNNQNDSVEIDLKQLFFVLLSKLGYIVLTAAAFAVVAFLYFNFIAEKQYQSTTQIYVINKESDTITSSDVSVSTSLSNDYVVLITTRPVLDQVIAELGLGITTSQLEGKISASVVTDSRIISITVEDSSPIMAKRIVDCVAAVSAERICAVMNSEMVNVVQEGEVSEFPSSPSVMKNTILAGLIGMFLAGAVVIIRFMLNDTIMTPEDVEKYLGISVIGTIPVFDQENIGRSETEKKKKESGQQ